VAKAVAEGAGRVIVIGGPAERLEVAAQWGADVCIDVAEVTSGAERAAIVKDLTDGWGAEVVLEMFGVPWAFSEGIDMLRPGGRYLIVGQAHQRDVPFNPSAIMHKQATLIGSRSAGVDHYWKALAEGEARRDRGQVGVVDARTTRICGTSLASPEAGEVIGAIPACGGRWPWLHGATGLRPERSPPAFAHAVRTRCRSLRSSRRWRPPDDVARRAFKTRCPPHPCPQNLSRSSRR